MIKKNEEINFKDKKVREKFWHSSAHILAHAIKKLFPDAKNTIGPAVENGFYYDFDDLHITPDDFFRIETEMKKIIQADYPFVKKEITMAEAKKLFKDNPYKIELAKEFKEKGEKLTIYKDGDFYDLCRGPHMPSTGYIKAIKLTKIAGAYWKGDQKNKQLTRVYGISFPSEKELKDYLKMREEAEKRDHKKIGKKLRIFSMHEESPGMPFLLENGMIIWNELLKFWREEHKKEGYQEIKTPIVLKKELWVKSGHWKNFRENMYTLKIDEQEYALKPMNCPGCMLVYKEQVHSYRDFPLKVGEIGHVYRHELSGTLSGLFRVRSFHQDDAHIFMTEDQITEEVLSVLKLAERIYKTFGLGFHIELSTRPEKSIGTDEMWEKATQGLVKALEKAGKKYVINEGDGAFYGPKIDLHVKDCLGRSWQCATIQLDMSLPERFDLTYEGKDGQKHRPVMIHRVIYGSLERFLGILIEHFAGKFPLWLSPVQVKILTVADRFNKYAETIKNKLEEHNIRVQLDTRTESISKKVRDAQLEQYNLILIIGEKEQKNKTLAVRSREGKLKFGVKLDTFLKKVKENINKKEFKIEF